MTLIKNAELRQRAVAIFALSAATAVLAACSSDDSGAGIAAPPTPSSEMYRGDYGIRVYVGEVAEENLLVIPPAPEVSAPSSDDVQAQGQGLTSTQGYVLLDPKVWNFGADYYPVFLQTGAWNLLLAAALECGANDGNALRASDGLAPTIGHAVVNPWNSEEDAWYIFEGFADGNTGRARFPTCDSILAHSEILLCTSDKLSELSEALGSVVWEGVKEARTGILPDELKKPWILPPQATEDKFIARDLAINALAHLNRLLLEKPWPMHTEWDTCAEGYALALESATDGMANSEALFGVSSGERPEGYFAPWDPNPPPGTQLAQEVTSDNVQRVAQERLELMSHIIRASGRNLKELIEGSVYADLAGAYEQAGQSNDPTLGNELFWGISDIQKGSPYNSVAHALRVLFGRWEIGTYTKSPPTPPFGAHIPHSDPKCEGVSALTGVQDGALRDVFVRASDPSQTFGLIEKLGIVIPDIDGYSDAALRGAIGEHAMVQAWDPDGEIAWDDFISPESQPLHYGGAVDLYLRDIPAADMRRALVRNSNTLQLHAGVERVDLGGVQGGDELGGFKLLAPAWSSAVQGFVIERGLERGDLVYDVMGSLAALQTSAQCAFHWRDASEIGWLSGTWEGRKQSGFQDAFLLGRAFLDKLIEIESLVESETDTRKPIANLTQTAKGELHSWLGPGRIALQTGKYGPWGRPITIKVTGIQPKDIGVATADDMKTAIGFAFGEPWQADCLSGLREECVGLTGHGTLTKVDPATVVVSGEGEDLTLSFSLDVPDELGAGGDAPNYLYVISDPEEGAGAVLGAFTASVAETQFVEYEIAVSHFQRKLANAVFGISRDFTASAGSVETYCIDGMPTDMFIPLENELTSDSDQIEDSWQHYLSLAESAARRADDLGEELIRTGLNRDLREEAASEELGRLCGVRSPGEAVTFNEGKVTGSDEDGALSICIDEPTYDVVFLTRSPWNGKSQAELADELADLMECDPSSPGDKAYPVDPLVCAKVKRFRDNDCETTPSNQECPLFEIGGLSNTPHPDEGELETKDEEDWDCGAMLTAIEDKNWGLVGKLATSEYGLRTKVEAALQNLSLVTLGPLAQQSTRTPAPSPADWQLMLDGIPILDSDAGNYQSGLAPSPACEESSGAGCIPTQFGDDIARLLGRSDSTAIDRVEMRRQLEGILWTMGAIAGRLPVGTITAPIPVANPSKFGDTERIPVPTIFGSEFNSSQLWVNGFELTRKHSSNGFNKISEDDVLNLGGLRFIPADIAQGELDADGAFGGHLPTWLRRVYEEAAKGNEKYYWAVAQNAERTFPLSPRDALSDWFLDVARQNPDALIEQLKYPTSHLGGLCTPDSEAGAMPLLQFFWAAKEDTSDWYQRWFLPAEEKFGGSTADGTYALWQTNGSTDPTRSGMIIRDVFHFDGSKSDDYQDGERKGICETADFDSNWEENDFIWVTPWRQAYNKYFGDQGSPSQPGYLRPTYWLAYQPASLPPQTCWIVNTSGSQSMPQTLASCINDEWRSDSAYWEGTANGGECMDRRFGRMTHTVLRPSRCSPDERMDHFVNAHFERDRADALREVGQALALTCMIGRDGLDLKSAIRTVNGPPPITKVDDLVLLEIWLERQRAAVEGLIGGMTLRGVPKRAVQDFKGGSNATGHLRGEHGQIVIDHGQDLSQIAMTMVSTHDFLRSIRDQISSTRRRLRDIDTTTQQKVLELELARVQANVQVMKGTARMLASIASAVVSAFDTWKIWEGSTNAQLTIAYAEELAEAGIDIDAGNATNSLLNQSEQLLWDEQQNNIESSLGGLSSMLSSQVSQLNSTLESLRSALLEAQQSSQKLLDNQEEAKYHAAKAAGLDYYRDVDENVVFMPVNTVYRRQYDALQIRYENALRQAKQLAYIARLSIEQRLGVRMNDIHEPIGALEAPSRWVDNVCSLTGVDYDRLSTFDVEGGDEADKEAIAAFVDGFVGDYVAQLRLFVEYYNVEYPSQSSEDLVAISLRDDLLSTRGQCTEESRNILYFSDELRGHSFVADQYNGWATTGCSATKCAHTQRGDTLPASAGAALVPPLGQGGVTWVYESVADGVHYPEEDDVPRPGRIQQVVLEAGSHVLSWWDMALSAEGDATTTPTSAYYRVWVLDPDGEPAATKRFQPGIQDWSERRSLSFDATVEGEYRVVIQASDSANSATLGSLAVANVQLEAAAAESGPTPYERTSASRLVVRTGCVAGSPEEFQSAFRYRCEGSACFYELDLPFSIDTLQLAQGTSPLIGKVAAGNFNYRHFQVALNVVGYGVLDCSQDSRPSCVANAYLEYDVDHSAHRVPVLSAFDERTFDFGTGSIRRAKALAAERYITIPMSGTDYALLQQPEFWKHEYFGRPLSGTYSVRIFDTPALRWDRVEDVQLVMHYKYWAPVSRLSSN